MYFDTDYVSKQVFYKFKKSSD